MMLSVIDYFARSLKVIENCTTRKHGYSFPFRQAWCNLPMTDFSFLCTFVPGSEKSTDVTIPVELSFRRTFSPCSCGSFVPRERTFQELSFPGTFLPVELSFLQNEYSNFRSNCQKCSKSVAVHLTVAYVH